MKSHALEFLTKPNYVEVQNSWKLCYCWLEARGTYFKYKFQCVLCLSRRACLKEMLRNMSDPGLDRAWAKWRPNFLLSLSLHSFYHYKQNFSVQFSGYSNAASAFNRKISRRGICGVSYWNLTDNKENRRTEKTSTKVQKELCTTDCRSVSRLFILKIENDKPKMP